MTKIRVGITDHAPPPFEIEREALGPDAELVFLNSRSEYFFTKIDILFLNFFFGFGLINLNYLLLLLYIMYYK